MYRLLYIIVILCMVNSLSSQTTEMIVPFYNNGKWGFMNKDKTIIVCPQYEEAYPSYSKRYRVKIKGKYGYINTKGELIIKAKYDNAKDFKYGLATVSRKGKEYSILSNGKKNKNVYGRCGTHHCLRPRINNDLKIISSSGHYGFIHQKLVKDTIPPMFDTIVPLTNHLMYFVKDSLIALSHEGTYWYRIDSVIQNLKFEYEEVKLFDCDFCARGKDDTIGIKKNKVWGYLKVQDYNDIFIEPKYLSIESLADGFALVQYDEGKYGYVDDQGNEYFIK